MYLIIDDGYFILLNSIESIRYDGHNIIEIRTKSGATHSIYLILAEHNLNVIKQNALKITNHISKAIVNCVDYDFRKKL